MGSVVKRITRPITKIAKKIIPKEIRPFLPYIAAGMVGPAGLGANFMSGITNQALRQALAAGITSAATDENGNPLRAAGLAAAPALLSQGVGALAGSGGPNTGEGLAGFLNKTKKLKDNTETISIVDRISSMANPETLGGQLKLGAAQTSVDQAAKFAELNQQEIDKYNQSLLSEGMADKGSRRNAIYQIYMNTGAYEADDVNSMLDKYGYASGGRVNLAGGGLEELMLGMDTGRFPKGSGDKMTKRFKRNVPTIDELINEEEDMDPKDKIIASLTSKLEEDENKEFDRSLSLGAKGLESLSKSGHSMEPVPMLRFAKGGEVEEVVEDLSIEGQTAGLLRNMIREHGYNGTITMWNDYKDMMRQGEINMGFEEFINQHGDMFGGAQGGLAMARGGEVEEVVEESETLMAGGPYTTGRDVEDAFGIWNGMGIEDKSLFEGFLDFYKQGSWRDQIMGQADVEENTMMASGPGRQGDYDNISMLLFGKPYKELFPEEVEQMQEYLQSNMPAGAANGGMIGMALGGQMNSAPRNQMKEIEGQMAGPDWFTKRVEDLMNFEGLSYEEASERAYNEGPLGDDYAKGGRVNYAGGGIMNRNLLNTGMDKDMRSGGFVPEGTKEKADDVPARLSKNEFVMTADAVRAAGGGSVNKGAQRMYNIMNQLEAKA